MLMNANDWARKDLKETDWGYIETCSMQIVQEFVEKEWIEKNPGKGARR